MGHVIVIKIVVSRIKHQTVAAVKPDGKPVHLYGAGAGVSFLRARPPCAVLEIFHLSAIVHHLMQIVAQRVFINKIIKTGL